MVFFNEGFPYLIHKTFNMSGNVWFGVDHESKFPGKAEGGEG